MSSIIETSSLVRTINNLNYLILYTAEQLKVEQLASYW